ncbi:DUF1284 domain-containing protein [Roseovarius ramblicola]|uniref:DUF1284 domain-containing protein n=1 Tax=Roseovarius ramblicola TaxID=2022336 RepID=A0ABV5I1U6_9RHOB
MTPPDLRFRPHHFLCVLGFAGKGYSDRFTANMARIVRGGLRAADGDETVIEVVTASDDICAPCPKRRGARCDSQEKVARLDARHAAALGLRAGDRLTWDEAQARIRRAVAPGDLSSLCTGCQWLDLGLCEAALARLHDQT